MRNNFKQNLFFFAALIFFPKVCLGQPAIEISPEVIDFEYILCDQIINKTVHVKNTGSEPLSISAIRPSCDCVECDISDAFLKPGEKRDIHLRLNSEQRQIDGKFTKYLYIQSDVPDRPISKVELKGTALRNPRQDGKIEINLFYSQDCRSCNEIRNNVIKRLRHDYPETLVINEYDISDINNYTKLIDMGKQYNIISKNAPMTLFIANTYLSGKEEIENDIDKIISLLFESQGKSDAIFNGVGFQETKFRPLKEGKETVIDRFKSFSALAVLGAGLADGMNPCAFATIVFLVSFLSFAGKTKREILIITASFAVTVFLTYFLLGLGLFKALTIKAIFRSFSTVIYYTAALFAFAFGVVNLYDALSYIKYRNPQAVKNKLPRVLTEKIHRIMRDKLKTRGLVFSAFATGFLVSLLESVCTGQVYLPTIVFITKEPSLRLQAYLYLFFYNLMFIVPLLIVAILCYIGSFVETVKKFSIWSVSISKIILSIIFFGLSLMLIIS